MSMLPWVLDFATLRMSDVAGVGGKNASLGEMISQLGGAGVRVPGGFARLPALRACLPRASWMRA